MALCAHYTLQDTRNYVEMLTCLPISAGMSDLKMRSELLLTIISLALSKKQYVTHIIVQ